MVINDHECDAGLSRSSAAILGFNYPVFGICGYSGSGKTTLIARLVQILRAEGLRVAVIKQDAHGLDIDRPGKDTDVLFCAGADVHIRDKQQAFFRSHDTPELPETIHRLAPHYDLLLVEGHKSADLTRKVWLCKPDETTPPAEATNISMTLPWHTDREAAILPVIREFLQAAIMQTPLYAGILIGGKSSRMGIPKHLIKDDVQTWLHKAVAAVTDRAEKVVILGGGEIPGDLRALPVLPDVDGGGGPLRGMRAAMRWAPRAGWLFTACDQPDISPEAIDWLLSFRRPGIWAVMPVLPGDSRPEPLLAYYDFRMAPLLERASRPQELAALPGVATPVIPDHLAPAWRNVNSPADLDGNSDSHHA